METGVAAKLSVTILVSCLYSSLTKSGDTGQDFIGGLCPDKGLGVRVRMSNVGPDGRLEGSGTQVYPSTQLAFSE